MRGKHRLGYDILRTTTESAACIRSPFRLYYNTSQLKKKQGSKVTSRIDYFLHLQVVRESMPTFKQCAARDPTQLIEKKYDTYLPDGMDTEVDKEDVIKGILWLL